MKRLLTVLVGSLTLLGLLGAPAVADPPATSTFSVTFTDENPCTGDDHEVTLNFVLDVHQHNNNTVIHNERTGSTSSGYTMIAGVESGVINGQVERAAFMDMWDHPDGSRFRVRGNFTFDLAADELVVATRGFDCIGRR